MSVSMAELSAYKASEKAKFIFLSLILIGMSYVILMLGLGSFVENMKLLKQQAVAVYISSWAVPMAVACPAFMLLAFGLLLKVVGRDKGALYTGAFNLAVGIGVVAILVRLPIGLMLDKNLEDAGYTYCYWYTSPANFSPQVWVRSPEYCVEQTGVVRRPLMDWIQALPEGGNNVTPAEVRLKALEMLAAYEAGERFLD